MHVCGSLDYADRSVVRGWVTTTGSETDKVMLDVLVGERVIGQVTAEQFRQDLLDHGIGDGRCAFEYALPAGLSEANFARPGRTELREERVEPLLGFVGVQGNYVCLEDCSGRSEIAHVQPRGRNLQQICDRKPPTVNKFWELF